MSTPLLTLTSKQPIFAAAFSPDGKRIVTGGREATLTLWDAEKATEIRTFSGHENDIRGVAFSPDGLRIASGSGDKTVRVWDPGNGKTVLTLKGFTPQVHGVAFAPDGKRIAGAGVGTTKDATTQIWDATTGQFKIPHVDEGIAAAAGWRFHLAPTANCLRRTSQRTSRKQALSGFGKSRAASWFRHSSAIREKSGPGIQPRRQTPRQ